MKRRRFVSSRDKTKSFPFFFFFFLNKSQNDLVLDKTAAKRRRFEAVVINPKRRRFGYLKAPPKRCRFVAVLSKTTSFWYMQNFKKKLYSQNDVVLPQKMTKRCRFDPNPFLTK